MFNIAKLFWLSCGCLLLANVAESGIVGDSLGTSLWSKINSACNVASRAVEHRLTKDDLKYLDIIEYDLLFTNTHSMNTSVVRSLLNTNTFYINRTTIIFIHGFIDNPKILSGKAFAAAYKNQRKNNILALDFHKLFGKFYLRPTVLVKYVGEVLGYFINELVEEGMDVEDIYLVGHSLGAHIAGFAGNTYQKLRPGSKLSRITGLDPVGPCFTNVDLSKRLDKSDAKFIDIIHTNINGYGIEAPIGHVDFYPNGGGKQQPGCSGSICSHNRVWILYQESVVRKEPFIGIKCDSWDSFRKGKCMDNDKALMGFNTSNRTEGVYYLRTRSFLPFGLGFAGSSPSIKDRLFRAIYKKISKANKS